MRSPRLSILVLAAALAGCSSLKVNTEYDPSAPYASYKTYAWNPTAPGPEQAPSIRNPTIQAQVVAAVDRELQAKGFAMVKPEANPDLLVAVHGWAQSRVEVSTYGYAYGPGYVYGPAYGPYQPMPVTPAVEVHNYTDGTLLIDFVDAKAMKLVWRGTATDTFTRPDLAAVKRTVDEATAQLIGAYPPKRK
jgi:hypothetical protein